MFFIFISATAVTQLHNRYINMPINTASPDHSRFELKSWIEKLL